MLLSLLVGLLLVFVLVHAKVLLLLLCLLLRLVGDAAEEGLVSFRPRATAGRASRANGGSTAHKAAGVGVAWLFFWFLAHVQVKWSRVEGRTRRKIALVVLLWSEGEGGKGRGLCQRACKRLWPGVGKIVG